MMTDSAHDTTPMTASVHATPPKAKPRPRTLRRCVIALLVTAMAVTLCWWTVTRSPLVRVVLANAIEDNTGLIAEMDRARFAPFGQSVIDGLSLRSPAIAGPAADVLDIAEIRVEMDLWSLFDGLAAVRSIQIDSPVVRVSQSDRTGAWNMATVIAEARARQGGNAGKTAPPRPQSGTVALPEVTMNGLVIELSEHDFDATNSSRELGRIHATGRLVADEAGSYRIELDEHPDVPRASGDPGGPGAVYFAGSGLRVEVDGTITPDGIDLGIGSLDLSRIALETLPRQTREVLEIMSLEGWLEGVRVTGGGIAENGSTEPLVATLSVDGVGVTLPINRSGAFATEGRLLRMTETTGTVEVGLSADGGINADMRGTIAGLPYTVTWSSQGLNTQAGFEAEFALEGARIQPENDVMLFIPEAALEPFVLFGRPTLTVDARVTVTRPEGGDATLLGVVGFRDGTASYQRFPYTFQDLEGTMTFTGSRTDIHRIVGVAPNGATVEANGWIGPYDNNARADITVTARGVPIDDTLRNAMEPDIRGVFDMVFNQPRYAELLEAGLVRRPGEPVPQTDPQLESAEAVPEFAVGGTADVVVRVTRKPGPVGDRWDTIVEATIDEAGMLPEPFAYPIFAENVTVYATESTASLQGGRYRGLSGGRALMDAQIGLGKGDDTIRIDIQAVDIPVDDRLVHALPNPDASEESVQQIVDRLRVEGVVDAIAGIRRRDSGRIGYDVEVTLNGIGARPDGETLLLDDVTGTAYLTERFLLLDAEARVSAPGITDAAPRVALTTSADLASLEETPPSDAGPGNRLSPGAASPMPESLRVRASSRGFDPALPIEHLVELFTPTSAASIVELRDRHRPSGRIDLELDLLGRAEGAPVVSIMIDAVDRFAADAIEGRLSMGDFEGELLVELGERVLVTFDDSTFKAWYDDDPLGRVAASGELRVDKDRGVLPGDKGFRLDANTIRFESPFVRTVAARLGGTDLDALLDRTNPRGLTHVEVKYDPPETQGGEANISARIEPEFVRVEALGGEALLAEVTGALVVGRRTGRVEHMKGRLIDPSISLGASGSVRAPSGAPVLELHGEWTLNDGSFDLPLMVSIESAGRSAADSASESDPPPIDLAVPPVRINDAMSEITLALLPPETNSILDASRVRVHERLSAEDVLVHMVRVAGEPLSIAVDGAVRVEGMAANVGTPLADADGTINIVRSRDAGFEIGFVLDRFLIAKASATNGRGRLVRNGADPTTAIQGLVAQMHGGRVTGHGQLTATPTPAGPKTAYEFTVSASGVGFDGLLGDFRGATDGSASSDSRLRAELTVAGFAGETLDRTGRGLIEIDGSRLIDLPIVLPLIEVSNLQVPTGERLEMARTEFYISGEYVTFDELSAFSDSIELFGYGVMRLPDLELDLRVHSEGARKVPVISDIVEGVRDELVTASVTGTLAKPEVGTTGLRGTRRLIAAVLGVQPSDDERRLEEIERRARERRKSRSFRP
jgi:hypothetical protein